MSGLPKSRTGQESPTVVRFPLEKRSDSSLVEGAKAGEHSAIEGIWERYSSMVRGVLLGTLGPDHAIEDLVQDVFLALLKGIRSLRDPAALRGYLASIAVSQAKMEIRRRKVRRWVGLSSSGELPEVASHIDPENRNALAALHRMLEDLSDRRRAAFVLRHVEGLEMLEVASALSISESTLRRELEAAREIIFTRVAREPALSEFLNRGKEGTP